MSAFQSLLSATILAQNRVEGRAEEGPKYGWSNTLAEREKDRPEEGSFAQCSKEGLTDADADNRAQTDGRGETSFECGGGGTMSKSRLRLGPSASSSDADKETEEGFSKPVPWKGCTVVQTCPLQETAASPPPSPFRSGRSDARTGEEEEDKAAREVPTCAALGTRPAIRPSVRLLVTARREDTTE